MIAPYFMLFSPVVLHIATVSFFARHVEMPSVAAPAVQKPEYVDICRASGVELPLREKPFEYRQMKNHQRNTHGLPNVALNTLYVLSLVDAHSPP